MNTNSLRHMALLSLTVLVTSCAHSSASVDGTMSGGILWPGGGEQPRIQYLWSMYNVHGGGGRSLASAVFGDPVESEDPRDSDVLINPHGVYFDGADRLYITDTGAGRVSVVEMDSMKSFIIMRSGDVLMKAPIAVASGPDGRIYISDSDMRMVGMYRPDGKFISFIDSRFSRPTGLALDSERGILYVADTWRHIIYKFDLDGKKLGSLGGRGEDNGMFNYPTHLAVGPGGELYVSDTLNFRVQYFSADGAYLGSFGLPGETYSAFDKIKGIAVDSEGHIYVTDSQQDMVKIYDREGRMLLFFGQKGRFYGDFEHPAGIYIDAQDRIYVADSLNRRVQAFQFLGGDGAGEVMLERN